MGKTKAVDRLEAGDMIRCTRCHHATRENVAVKLGPDGYRFCVTCGPIAREEFATFGAVTRCPPGRRALEDVARKARKAVAKFEGAILDGADSESIEGFDDLMRELSEAIAELDG